MAKSFGISDNTVSSKGQLRDTEFVTFTFKENAKRKILFVGNSITRHGILESIGWTRDCGMAASSIDKDYVHVTIRELEKIYGAVDFCIAQAAVWEWNYRKDEEILSTFQPAVDFDADTIVIRIGENSYTESIDTADYADHFEKMVKFFSSNAKKVIVTSLFWEHPPIDNAIKIVCERNPDYIYVPIRHLGERDECKALGLFEHSGVAGHPGDYGMKKISEAILGAIEGGGLKTTNIPSGEVVSSLFTAKINGKDVDPCFARVSAMPFNCVWPDHQRDISQTEEAAFISFSMSTPTEIELTAAREFEEVIIRPLSKGIKPKINGRTIRFTIEQAGQYSVELDGVHNPLFVFADPDSDFCVDIADENVIYYPAGVHHAGLIELTDGQTLYIDRGAVVYGWVRAISAKNIRIVGNGILDNSLEERTSNSLLVTQDIKRRDIAHDIYSPILRGVPCDEPSYPITGTSILKDTESFKEFQEKWNMVHSPIQLYGCKNAEVNGIIIRDSVGFTVTGANCDNLICDNLKLVGMWRYNSDGIDLFNSANCIIRNSFIRSFDDSIVLKGIAGWDERGYENILVENCVVWNDWGRALEIGAETCADEYKNIIFRNCDIIHSNGIMLDIQNCDRAWVHDVVFENINTEYSRYDCVAVYQQSDDMTYTERHGEAVLIACSFGGGTYFFSNDKQKGRISRITYRNIHVYADKEDFTPRIVMENNDDTHTVSDVVYDGIFVNGKKFETS